MKILKKKSFVDGVVMASERILCVTLSVISISLVSRYLGPEKYGSLSYVQSVIAIFVALNHLGLPGLAVKELLLTPNKKILVFSLFVIKAVFSIISIAILISLAFILSLQDQQLLLLFVVSSLSLALCPFDVFNYWFNHKSNFRLVSKSVISSQILGLLSRVILVFTQAKLIYFPLASTFEGLSNSIILSFNYFRSEGYREFVNFRFCGDTINSILKKSWLIYFGTFCSVIYFRVDVIMLQWLSNDFEVGNYSVAAKISETWIYFPTMLMAIIFPQMVDLYKQNILGFQQKMQFLLDILFCASLTAVFLTIVFGKGIISLLFGEEYRLSYSLLVIHSWSSIFIFMRSAFSKYIIITSQETLSALTQFSGAISNILLNLVLIPSLGARGAALATLFSYAISSYLSLSFFKSSRIVFRQMSLAFIAPIKFLTSPIYSL